ncbi:flippase-like domain-containing protein [Candidatus Woesearchaeota archaeon]|nr:flippase-like domain-containing protein [Candidatus Woesearchaeota archaeon]
MEFIDKGYKYFFRILKYIAGPLVLFLLFYKMGLDHLSNILTTTDPLFFILAYITFILSIAIAAVNVYLVLIPLKKLEKKPFLKYFLLSRITSLILPGRLGEFSITYFLEKEDINLGRGMAAVLTDKLTTIACSLVIGLIAFYTILGGENILTIFAYVLAAAAVLCFLLIPAVRRFIKKWILRKYAYHFDGFSATLFSYLKEHRRITFINIGITLIRIFVIALSAKFMFLALRTDVPFITLVLVGGIETLSTFVPLTVNGLGIKQAVGIYVFTAAGISPYITAARYFIGLFIQYSFGFITALLIKPPEHQQPKIPLSETP